MWEGLNPSPGSPFTLTSSPSPCRIQMGNARECRRRLLRCSFTNIPFFLSVGDDNDRESSLFLSPDTDPEHYNEDRNMALFEVTVTDVPRPSMFQASWSLQMFRPSLMGSLSPGGDGQHSHGVVAAAQTGHVHQPDSGGSGARGGRGWCQEGPRHGLKPSALCCLD